jgi:hypothetical protein
MEGTGFAPIEQADIEIRKAVNVSLCVLAEPIPLFSRIKI